MEPKTLFVARSVGGFRSARGEGLVSDLLIHEELSTHSSNPLTTPAIFFRIES